MSYEIIYGSQFIKVGNKYIPLVLNGSNNCYEINWNGKERRERNWNTLFDFFSDLDYSETEIMEKLNLLSDDMDYITRSNKTMRKKEIIKFYQNSIKKALTIEEIIKTGYYISYLKCFLSIWNNHSNTIELKEEITTTEALINWISNAKETRKKYKQKKEFSAYICVDFPKNDIIKFKEVLKTFNDDDLVYAKDKKHYYIVEILKNGFSMDKDKTKALILPYKEFKDKCDYGYKFFKYNEKDFEKAKIENQEKYYIIIDGYSFIKITRGGVQYSYYNDCGKKFGTMKQVEQTIEKIKNKIGDNHKIEFVEINT